MPRVSVVVVTWNGRALLERFLPSVLASDYPDLEVVVADNASADGTAEWLARAHPGVVVVRHPENWLFARGNNAAVPDATGGVLCFLNNDVEVPPGWLRPLVAALAEPGVVAGCFETTFDRDGAFGPVGRAFMRLWEARLWMRWHRFAFGDRALFVRRDVFEAVGGFPDQPIFEDLDLVRAVRRRGRFAFLDAAVVTSARRYRRGGAVRQQLRNLALWAAWNAGVAPGRLKRFYPD